MYEMLTFADERVGQNFKNFDALKSAVEQDFSYTSHEIPFRNITVSPKGEICINGEFHLITLPGFEKFCAVLGIPNPFARKIPWDLLKINIESLISVSPDMQAAAIQRNDGAFANLTKPNIRRLDNLGVISELEKLDLGDNFKTLTISDQGLEIALINSTDRLEPRVGDITEIGLNIVSSETGYIAPAGRLYLNRLVCTNGAVAPNDWGRAWGSNPEDFAKSIGSLTFDIDRLRKIYDVMPAHDITDEKAWAVWNAVNRVTGTQGADQIFGWDPDKRAETKTTVALRKLRNRRELFNPEQPADIGMSYYDVYNNVTASANSCNAQGRYALQNIGGKLVSDLMRRRN